MPLHGAVSPRPARWWVALVLCLLPTAGCGDVAFEPLRPDAGATDADLSSLSCEDEAGVRARVFEVHCGSGDCHDEDRPRAGLDLVSPGVTTRLRTLTSVHEDCEGRPIVEPGSARGSFLLEKVLGTHGSCGDPMPLEGALSLEERRCLVQWIDAM